jgi:hypothetical protein
MESRYLLDSKCISNMTVAFYRHCAPQFSFANRSWPLVAHKLIWVSLWLGQQKNASQIGLLPSIGFRLHKLLANMLQHFGNVSNQILLCTTSHYSSLCEQISESIVCNPEYAPAWTMWVQLAPGHIVLDCFVMRWEIINCDQAIFL